MKVNLIFLFLFRKKVKINDKEGVYLSDFFLFVVLNKVFLGLEYLK